MTAVERVHKRLGHSHDSAFKFHDNSQICGNLQNLSLDGRGKSMHTLKKLTVHLPQTLKTCNSEYSYEIKTNPKRVLTKPSVPVSNKGFDNSNNDLIIYVNDIFEADSLG